MVTDPSQVHQEKEFMSPGSCADTAVEDGRHDSNVYEVSMWLWQFGCGNTGKPNLGCLTIKETLDRQDSAC
jgi:hypothetical protein